MHPCFFPSLTSTPSPLSSEICSGICCWYLHFERIFRSYCFPGMINDHLTPLCVLAYASPNFKTCIKNLHLLLSLEICLLFHFLHCVFKCHDAQASAILIYGYWTTWRKSSQRDRVFFHAELQFPHRTLLQIPLCNWSPTAGLFLGFNSNCEPYVVHPAKSH